MNYRWIAISFYMAAAGHAALSLYAAETPARIYHQDAISAELTDKAPIPFTPITHKPVFVGEREQFGYDQRGGKDNWASWSGYKYQDPVLLMSEDQGTT